jgi:hypothetical protein
VKASGNTWGSIVPNQYQLPKQVTTVDEGGLIFFFQAPSDSPSSLGTLA